LSTHPQYPRQRGLWTPFSKEGKREMETVVLYCFYIRFCEQHCKFNNIKEQVFIQAWENLNTFLPAPWYYLPLLLISGIFICDRKSEMS
jgi:hypothetical protein